MNLTREYLKLLNSIYHPGITGDFKIPVNPTQKEVDKLKKSIERNKKKFKLYCK